MSEPCWSENGVYVAISEKGKRQYTLIWPPGWRATLVRWLVLRLMK